MYLPENLRTSAIPFFTIQAQSPLFNGDQDDIVDWEYNIKFLQAKIQKVDLFIIPGARHQLANESEELRALAFELIFDYLNP